MTKNKRILITGGTGSFGQRITRTIMKNYDANNLVIFSRDELKQFNMMEELGSDNIEYIIGDVRDKDRLKIAMQGVDIVIHAAALKQVPSTEYNPVECIKTNIHGAENVIAASIHSGVKKVIALSTDKAGNPISLYGASKLVSDKLFVSANNFEKSDNTKFSVVRYGNVVGSRGSVVPFFQKLIDSGSDYLPITDKEMTRFWITLQQGVDFVLKNFDRMKGGEIFIPKIPSAKITDLAIAMAPNLVQKIIGIRPGEKIHETLCPSENSSQTLEFSDHYVICPSIKFNNFDEKNYELNELNESGKYVQDGFEYSSGLNPHFLTIEELKNYNNLP
tara:strand:+ start:2752 stop:3750 length:999 start_codon:yes stop_codon:yes gene_type:complete